MSAGGFVCGGGAAGRIIKLEKPVPFPITPERGQWSRGAALPLFPGARTYPPRPVSFTRSQVLRRIGEP